MFNFLRKDLNIFLIRHGQSIINTGDNIKEGIPVHQVPLTDYGMQDCRNTAKYLSDYLEYNKIKNRKSSILYSPYKVTTDTMKIFNEELNISDIKQEISLIERRFGTAETLSWENWCNTYEDESSYFSKYYNNSGKFYAKFSLGDAPYDTALRVKQAIDEVLNQYNNSKVRNIFIFTHGITLRTFVMRFCNYPVEWYENETNPDNCAIYHIVYNKKRIIDKGYIHDKKYYLRLVPLKTKGFLKNFLNSFTSKFSSENLTKKPNFQHIFNKLN